MFFEHVEVRLCDTGKLDTQGSINLSLCSIKRNVKSSIYIVRTTTIGKSFFFFIY